MPIACQIGHLSYTSIFDEFHLAYCEVNVAGDITDCSSRFYELTGYQGADLLGKTFSSLCSSGKDGITSHLSVGGSDARSSRVSLFECEMITRNASREWVRCYVVARERRNGVFEGWRLVLTEIEEKEHLRGELMRQHLQISTMDNIQSILHAIIGMIFLIEDKTLVHKEDLYIKILRDVSDILYKILTGAMGAQKKF